jgi:hypothetical protein
MKHHEEFDELMHDALGEYREAEPLAGMEARVLERLHSQAVECRRAWWMWGAIATCAALVLIGVWLGVKNPTPPKEGGVGHPAPPVVAVGPASRGPDLPLESEARAQPPIAAQNVRKPGPAVATAVMHPAAVVEVRPAVFPLPTTLSPEERAFMAALQKAPDSASVAPGQDKEITIAEIEIKPLVIGGVTSSEDSGEKQ